jgi:prolipoprotein diacylglyceryl transferase
MILSVLSSIKFTPTNEMLSIGDFTVGWYGFLFAMGFFLSYVLMYIVFKKEKVPIKMLDWLTFWMFVATLVGARLGHVFFYEWSYYKDHLSEIPMVWKGGLASHGAGFAIIITMVLFIRAFKLNTLWLFDRLAIVIPVTAAFVRFGNLMNSEIYGIPTKMPWGFIFVHDPAAGMVPRHPTQLYEAFSYLAITLAVFLIWRKHREKTRRGLLVGIFLTAMFTMRFLIEFVKTEQMPFEKGMALDMGQWLSIPFILLGIFFIYWAYRSRRKPDPASSAG